MAQYFAIHPTHPQPRLIRQAAEIVRRGGLIAYPTDSCYALGCHLGDADAQARLRRARGMDDKHHLTLMCRDLSEIAAYALVDNAQFRLLKAATPGSYTFILRATREVPRRLMHPRRKSIGVRVPAHAAARALLAEMGEPMLSATLLLPDAALPLSDAQQIRAALEHQLDLVIDSGPCGVEPSTVIDLTGEAPVVLRAGKGSLAVLGESL
ncbi:MAG: L-threonylcarbamoyladenylate synthase [Betaproteobacteria bacterium]|nr:L-threonylcarbamoyladenylate synthase [Betaproteobacteria bacterium]MDH5579029.1 L-threonylcarbamoyladenylate synthase [Betaproteobacteria bacterium]